MIEENFAAKRELQLVVPVEMSSLWYVRVETIENVVYVVKYTRNK